MKSFFNKKISKISKTLVVVLFIFFMFLFFHQSVNASINRQLNYQGKLTGADKIAVSDDDYNIEFKLYTVPTGGTAIWTETRTSTDAVSVEDGLFSVLLGEVSNLDSVDFNQTLYLGVNIGGTSTPSWDGEMSPRKKLATAPSAFEADKLDGIDSSQFVRSDQPDEISVSSTTSALTVTQSGTGDIINLENGSGNVFTVTDDGYVGIGTTTPSARLSIKGTGTGTDKAFIITDSSNVPKLTVLDNGNTKFTGNVGVDAGYTLYFGAEEVFGGSDTGIGDYGYISFTNDNNTYAYWGDSSENSAMIIGTQNDVANSMSDSLVLRGAAANIFDPVSGINTFTGKVGIGNTNPTATLHIVNGSSSYPAVRVGGGTGSLHYNGTKDGSVLINPTDGDRAQLELLSPNGGRAIFQVVNNLGTFLQSSSGDFIVDTDYGSGSNYKFAGSSGTRGITFSSAFDAVADASIIRTAAGKLSITGSVGIGTTTPSARLSIKGVGTGTDKAFIITDSSNVPKLTVLDNGNTTLSGDLYVGATLYGPSSAWSIDSSGNFSGTANYANYASSTDYAINADAATYAANHLGDFFTGGGYSLDAGNNPITGVSLGSVSAPSLSFYDDSNTGIYSSAADTIDFAIGGAKRLSVATSSGYTTLGSGGNKLWLTDGVGLSNNGTITNVNSGGNIKALSAASWAITDASDNEYVRFSAADSSVGIGTTTPSARLSIKGVGTGTDKAFIITDSSNVPKLTVLDNGNTTLSGDLYVGATLYGPGSYWSIDSSGNFSGTASYANFANTASSATYADSASYADYANYAANHLGDFFTGGGYSLDAGNNPITGVSLGSVSAPSLSFYDDSNTGIYSSAADTIDFATGGTNRITINSSGNVSIGTTTATEKLNVNGSIQILSSAGYLALAGTGNWSWSAPQIGRTSGSTIGISDYNGVQLGGYNGSAYGARMTVLGTGNVGIGTDSPGQLLELAKATNPIIQTRATTDYGSVQGAGNGITYGELRFQHGMATSTYGYYPGIVAKFDSTDASYGRRAGLDFLTTNIGSVTAMSITGDGKVGIGTTTPSARLHVYPNANSTVGAIVQGDNNQSANIQEWHDSSSNVLSYIDDDGDFVHGNFNIGTNSIVMSGYPTYLQWGNGQKLEDNGNGGLAMSSGYALSIEADTDSNGSNGTGGYGYMDFKTRATSRLFIDNDGEIGIGNSSPTAKLNVTGNANIDGEFRIRIASESTDTGRGIHFTPATWNGTQYIRGWGNSGGSINLVGASTGSGNDDTAISLFPGNGYITFGTNSSGAAYSERMRIDNGGNVGIATTTAGYKLTVAGDVNLTGALRFSGSAGSNGYILQSTGTGAQWSALNVDSLSPIEVGNGNSVSGSSSSGFGSSNDVGGNEATSVGYANTASGDGSSAVGSNNTTSGTYSFAFGDSLTNPTSTSVLIGAQQSTAVFIGSSAGSSVQFYGYGSGTLSTNANGVITSSSDERLKDVMGGVNYGLSDLLKIDPIKYKWKENTVLADGHDYVGFSAQNIQEVIPEAVSTNGSGYLSLQDRPIMALAVNSIKELNLKIASSTAENLAFMKETEININNLLTLDKENKTVIASLQKNIENLIGQIESFGLTVVNGIAHFAELTVGRMMASTIVVKNTESPEETGIVIYDRVTNEPICVYFENNELKHGNGMCNEIGLNNSTSTTVVDNLINEQDENSDTQVMSVDVLVDTDLATSTLDEDFKINESIIIEQEEIIPTSTDSINVSEESQDVEIIISPETEGDQESVESELVSEPQIVESETEIDLEPVLEPEPESEPESELEPVSESSSVDEQTN